jgi:hypothetical protein
VKAARDGFWCKKWGFPESGQGRFNAGIKRRFFVYYLVPDRKRGLFEKSAFKIPIRRFVRKHFNTATAEKMVSLAVFEENI